MSVPSFLRAQPDGDVWLSVKVQPRASADEICQPVGKELKIKVTAPPVDSAANEALLRFLAETLGCARGALTIVRGGTSRHKVIAIRGMVIALIAERLSTQAQS